MPTWVSNERGILHPAKERVALKNLSDKTIYKEMSDTEGKKFKVAIPPMGDYIYEGADRAALFQWWEENGKPSADRMKEMEGKVTFGEDFRTNDEFMKQFANARQSMGFNTVEDYLKFLGYDEKKRKEEFEKKSQSVNVHDLPPRMSEIKKLGGGINTAKSGGDRSPDRYGGFGDAPNA
jgi:hypothetical protein